MNEGTHKGMQDLGKNRHGVATIAGVVLCVLLALVAGRDVLYGLVMGTVLSSGLGIGRQIASQITGNVPEENFTAAILVGPFVGGIIVGVITAIILSLIQGAIDVVPVEGDDTIARIVKYFFDSGAAVAVGAGAILGGWVNGLRAN